MWHRMMALPIAAALTASTARAEMIGGMFMGHHGSTVQEFSDGPRVEFRYSGVRPGLPVRSGTVLFRGTRSEDGRLRGTAYVFRRGCPPAPYEVTGRQTPTRVVLKGAAPIREPHSCAIAGYRDTGPNARLVFDIAE